MIRNLRGTWPGKDGLSLFMFKENENSLADIITYTCKKSWQSGVFSTKLPDVVVVCIYKAGKGDHSTNYRPISLLPCFSKNLEKILYNQRENHLNEKVILPNFQHRLKRGMSSEYAVNTLSNSVHECVNLGLSPFESSWT